jgi:hypothetical protein
MRSSDPDAQFGFTNDPAETTSWCAWFSFGKRIVYIYPWKVQVG